MNSSLSTRALAPKISALQTALHQVNTCKNLVAGQAARVAALDASQTTIIANAKRLLFIFQDNLKASERTLEMLRRQSAE